VGLVHPEASTVSQTSWEQGIVLPLEPLWLNPMDWALVNNRHLLLTVLQAGSPTSKLGVLRFSIRV
jgi:hypothetical protein